MNYIALAVSLLLVGADQLIKRWAATALAQVGTIPLIEGVFHFTYAENRGAAFSIFSGRRIFLIILVGAIVLAGIVLLISNKLRPACLNWTLAMIIAGGLGNLIDRIRLGYVIDYLDFCLIDFAIFNFADMLIVCGAILMAVIVLYTDWKKSRAEK